MKRPIGLPVTRVVESGKKRGFCPTLAACGCGGGVHPCTRVALDEKRFMLQGRAEGAMEN